MNPKQPKSQRRWMWLGLVFLLSPLLALAAPNPNATAHFKRGLELSLQQNWKAAEAEYREAVRLEPSNLTYRSYLADALAAQGKFTQAKELVQQQKKLEQTAAKPAQPPKASTTTKPTTPTTTAKPSPPVTKPPVTPEKPTVTTKPPTDDLPITVIESTLPDQALNTAIQLYEAENWPQAEAEYRRVLRLYPKLDEGWNGLVDTYFKQSKWGDAEKAYLETVRLKPEEAYYHAQLASALLKRNRDEAMKEALKAICLGLEDHEVFDELGLTVTPTTRRC
jgi:tetratricopeptide (TPR) repeat protein